MELFILIFYHELYIEYQKILEEPHTVQNNLKSNKITVLKVWIYIKACKTSVKSIV